MPGLPASVMNNRLDTLAAKPLARARYSETYADTTCGANIRSSATWNSTRRP
ncbi:hypothetical protein ACFWPX_08840 [Nocardia sp. NPDC058518]|uniref:hypothetical protein n=1 Tax=Nocardia sp. NPDC058518 TaxID=3346534 RepID=UPI003653F94A